MSKRKIRGEAGAALVAALAAVLLSGCGQSMSAAASTVSDGTYSGQSAVESDGSYGVVSFTVASGTVTEADFVVYDADGTAHDDSYGLGADGTPRDATFYQRAQAAIAAEKEYVTQFVETGDQNEVDSIAGASLSYRLFLDAVSQALVDNGNWTASLSFCFQHDGDTGAR